MFKMIRGIENPQVLYMYMYMYICSYNMAGDAGDRAAGEELSDSPSRFRSGADAPPVHWRATLLKKNDRRSWRNFAF